jgi:hypothetical protein
LPVLVPSTMCAAPLIILAKLTIPYAQPNNVQAPSFLINVSMACVQLTLHNVIILPMAVHSIGQ